MGLFDKRKPAVQHPAASEPAVTEQGRPAGEAQKVVPEASEPAAEKAAASAAAQTVSDQANGQGLRAIDDAGVTMMIESILGKFDADHLPDNRKFMGKDMAYRLMMLYCLKHQLTFNDIQEFNEAHDALLSCANNTMDSQWALVDVDELKRITANLPGNMKVFIEVSAPDKSTVDIINEQPGFDDFDESNPGEQHQQAVKANPAFGIRVSKNKDGESCLFIYTSY